MLATEVQVAVSAQPVEEVYTQLLQDKSRLILDVRNEEDFARWRVEGRQSLEVINIPYFDFIEDEQAITTFPDEFLRHGGDDYPQTDA